METFVNRVFHHASPLRTFIETLIAFAGLSLFTALLYGDETNSLYLVSMLFFINPLCALLYAVRLSPPDGTWIRQSRVELLRIAFIPVVLRVGLALLSLVAFTQPVSGNTFFFEIILVVVLAFPYLFFRVMSRLWVWWERIRQKRLIWSLVHSQLMAVAILQALVVIPLMLLLMVSNSTADVYELNGNLFAVLLLRVQMILPLLGLAILGATGILILLLPVSITVSYFFARRTRRRLDTLLNAAHAARDGDYATRITVTGEDEISKLQTDFNTMIASLQTTVRDLNRERERVNTLLKSRQEMVVSVSHELRTPIATIRAYLESAQRVVPDADMAIIEREFGRLQTLIDDLFALSRAEVDQLTMNLAPVDVLAEIRRVVETVAPIAWNVNRVEVIAQLPRWSPMIRADENRLEQCLRNLIHNSLRYTPPGGVIVISVITEDDFAVISVRDTGSGIAPDDLPHVWERYFRGEKNGGSGLGLALVKSFIEAMGGQVRVESRLGEGSAFFITLPFAEGERLPLPATNLRQFQDTPETTPL